MLIRVKLPAGPLIPYLALCKAIAEAIGPKYQNLEGVDCVSGKIYPPDAPTRILGIAGPYPLDEADRQALSKVLVELPRLHYPMSEVEIASFMDAYKRLPTPPKWTPLLVTEETIRQRKFEFNRIKDQHLESLRQEHRAGRLVPVGTNHVPLNALQVGAHLTRKDAIAYLERHGLEHSGEDSTASPMQDCLSSEAEHLTPDADPAPLQSGTIEVGRPRYNVDQKAEAVRLSNELFAAGATDFREQVAKKFGVSARTIYEWTKADAKLKKKEPTFASLIQGIGKK